MGSTWTKSRLVRTRVAAPTPKHDFRQPAPPPGGTCSHFHEFHGLSARPNGCSGPGCSLFPSLGTRYSSESSRPILGSLSKDEMEFQAENADSRPDRSKPMAKPLISALILQAAFSAALAAGAGTGKPVVAPLETGTQPTPHGKIDELVFAN